ncbi:glycosyltransferase family 25 protein [Zooshikella harenae]|uniref:Glycosyltransferase family 25 protein n=1 Tax=Zooshikella harenae TaxID=2827238 RepID=A0ABS5ZJA7_9GAMM|nr:glycosyltransferase family 25 protein [Zooshikella harenae]MBU2714169.1 glycosyltransferase family 25 protein [Zooshikella harenae]
MQFAVDKVYCISLKERRDRQNFAKRNLALLEHDVEFWLVDKDHQNPERGCYNSHRAIAKHALDRGYQRILVFEDDVVFDRYPSTKQMERINKFLRAGHGDIFYLGGLLGKLWFTHHLNVVRGRLVCMHAYILHQSGLEKIVANEYQCQSIDVFCKRTLNAFAFFPLLASQQPANFLNSDITHHVNHNTDKLWRRNRRRQYWSVIRNIKYTLLDRPSYWKE